MELIGNYIETIKVAVNPVDGIDGIPLDACDNHVYVNVARSNDNLVVYEDYCIRSRSLFYENVLMDYEYTRKWNQEQKRK